MTEKIYTTGMIAKMCRVAPRTVSKWMDSGKLKGYRIPGGQDRRFLKADVVRFMAENGMPDEFCPDHEAEQEVHEARTLDQILVVGGSPDVFADTATSEVTHVRSVFAAGIAFAEVKPTVVVVDLESIGRIDACLIADTIKGLGVLRLAVCYEADKPVSFDGSILLRADAASTLGLKAAVATLRKAKAREAS